MVLIRVSSILQVWRGEVFWERLWDYLMLLRCGTFSWQKSRELRLNQNWTKLKDYRGFRGILLWLVRCWLCSETNETQILASDNTRQVSDVCELHETLAIWGGNWCNTSEFSAWREKLIQGIRSERTADKKTCMKYISVNVEMVKSVQIWGEWNSRKGEAEWKLGLFFIFFSRKLCCIEKRVLVL